jgi:GNAT superfamily N-acetyltransferase
MAQAYLESDSIQTRPSTVRPAKPAVRVKAVETYEDERLFLEFPWSLYRDDPNWIPPIRMDQKELVGFAEHPFYEKNEAQTFLAFRDGQVCGRISAIHNRVHNEYRGEQIGFFGFFECIDDQQVADALFNAARSWLAQRGLLTLRGPTNPGFNYTQGLLIEGFDSPPTFMMTYNPPYYSRLLEGYGFRKAQDLYAYYGNLDMLPKSSAKLGPVADQIAERFGIRIREVNRWRFRQDVELFLDLYNRAMSHHWGFSPMSPAEMSHMAASLRHLVVPELALAAEIDGKTIGAVFALPDYNPRIRQIDGKLFPFGFIRLLWGKRRIKKVRILAAAVNPEYQRMGVGIVLLRAMVPKAMVNGLQEAEYSWVMESNQLSRGSLEKGGARRIKSYRLYDWEP